MVGHRISTGRYEAVFAGLGLLHRIVQCVLQPDYSIASAAVNFGLDDFAAVAPDWVFARLDFVQCAFELCGEGLAYLGILYEFLLNCVSDLGESLAPLLEELAQWTPYAQWA